MGFSDLPPVWVVSLARAVARRTSVVSAFDAIGMDVTILEAVDGLELTPDQLALYSQWRAFRDKGRGMSRKDLGCALSHLGAYRRLLAEGLDRVLIVEDDVVPTPDLVRVLGCERAFPRTWDVITLHSLFASASPVAIPDGKLIGPYQLCSYERTPFGTQCYLINASAAARVLRVAYPIRLPADDLLFRRRPAGLRIYGIEPSPVVHGDPEPEVGAAAAQSVDRSLVGQAIDRSARLLGKIERRVRP